MDHTTSNIPTSLTGTDESIEIQRGLDISGEQVETTELPRPSFRLPIILFTLTVLTTLFAGATQQGVNPFREPLSLLKGIPFSFTLLAILLTHEFGHYFTSRYHKVPATLPYFIPAPSFIGTFGAFIRMTSPILRKKAIFDIGISGPIAGFVVAIVAVVVGLDFSTIIRTSSAEGLKLGSPLIFSWLSHLILGDPGEGYDVLLHPIAFAGWIGLFVTSLNLIPIGQLDGGHVVYALFGDKQWFISLAMIPILLWLGYVGWSGWFVWAFLPLIFGLRHPPVVDKDEPLDRRRIIVGWLGLIMFAITFIPVPFSF
jgi:membrane-associated protease RseP (regulator of RpoE activity)